MNSNGTKQRHGGVEPDNAGSEKGMQGEMASLDPRLQSHIGRKLQDMYDAYLNEPIPDHLADLLERLDSTTAGKGRQRDPGSRE
jgi:hypothetical protein